VILFDTIPILVFRSFGMLVSAGTTGPSKRRVQMKVKCCQVGLFLVLLISSVGTNAAASYFPGSCPYPTSATGDMGRGRPVDVSSQAVDEIRNSFIQSYHPGILQSAAVYGQGLPNLKTRVDPFPGSVPSPVPMYILMFWVEWACRA
jgi:hypothetical protein